MEDHSDIGSDTGNVGDTSSEPRLVEDGDRRITSLSDADREAVDRLFQDGLDHENTENLDDRETAVLQGAATRVAEILWNLVVSRLERELLDGDATGAVAESNVAASAR